MSHSSLLGTFALPAFRDRLPLLLTALGLALGACSPEEAPPPVAPTETPPPVETATAPREVPVTQEAAPVPAVQPPVIAKEEEAPITPPTAADDGQFRLLPKRERVLTGWAVDNEKRRDPNYDNWRSEVLNGSSGTALKALLPALLDRAGVRSADLPALLSEQGFEGFSELRPDGLKEVFRKGGIQVLRPTTMPVGLHPVTDLPGLVKALRVPYLPDAEIGTFFKIINIDIHDAHHYATRIVAHFDGPGPDGRIQQNLDCDLEWETLANDEEVRIRSLVVDSFEEIHSAPKLFADLTQYIMGWMPYFESEILTGVGEYRHRSDMVMGEAFVGAEGLAVGDVNGDGYDDVYLLQEGGRANRLLLRRPDGRVTDASAASGLGFLEKSRSALILDLDNDRDQDLAVSLGPNILLAYNDGNGQFSRFVRLKGTGTESIYSMSAADADNDGDLDLYAVRYTANGLIGGVPTPYYNANNGATNLYWRNDGEQGFTLATEEVGLNENNTKFSLASIWEDFDGDGDQDLYVANDFGQNNLYLNDGGHFHDVAPEVGAEDQAAGMGVSVADYDLDGDPDILISNMFSSAGLRIVPQDDKFLGGKQEEVHQDYVRHARGNTLLSNNGDGTFTDVTVPAHVAIGGWAWGAEFVDFNNDGYADIYVPNGFITNTDTHDL